MPLSPSISTVASESATSSISSEDLLHRLALADDVVEPVAAGEVSFERDQFGDVAKHDHAAARGSSAASQQRRCWKLSTSGGPTGVSELRPGRSRPAALLDRLADLPRPLRRTARPTARSSCCCRASGLSTSRISQAARLIPMISPSVVERNDPLDQAVENRLEVLPADFLGAAVGIAHREAPGRHGRSGAESIANIVRPVEATTSQALLHRVVGRLDALVCR